MYLRLFTNDGHVCSCILAYKKAGAKTEKLFIGLSTSSADYFLENDLGTDVTNCVPNSRLYERRFTT